MDWSATSATKAYLDTLKLCGDHKRRCGSWMSREPGSNEFISAIAAGMKAKLIVEVTYGLSPSTVALATAARHSGGRLVCILPEPVLAEAKKVIKDSGLKDLVEFRTGDPCQLLPDYENIDFSLVDCKNDEYTRLLKLIDVNPTRSVVVANNLVGGKKGLGGQIISRGVMKDKDELVVRSTKHPVGKGMEVTMIGKSNAIVKRNRAGGGRGGGEFDFSSEMRGSTAMIKNAAKSRWIVKVDQVSGEEHIYRLPKRQSLLN
ncbi:uncharacterized protein LOC8263525 [Ricinus communis]|uniref:uncharacterized protein LOC8263525 n=1 Tax=Ricinus communis TaxID=3988 RepID=UPI000772B0CC|nr:uncharacterized protein LOC8263525 [Ricinus communis]|eukprot:XP_015577362.1 uncharacterized protein LOC8263525 [Ricinus communis]